jgi:hypothetical protein
LFYWHHYSFHQPTNRKRKVDSFDKLESNARLCKDNSAVTKVRYIGENRDGTALLEVALNGECKADDLFVCNVEQLSMYHSYGKASFIKAATTNRNKWVRLLGASTTRSMSKSSECANSVTDNITQSPFLLRSITTTLSEVPATLTFGQVPCGADRVSVKNRSENSDCTLCSVTELADYR